MATRHDQVTSHYFSFDDDEIVTIIAALRCYGEEELADEIQHELGEYKPVGAEIDRRSSEIGNISILYKELIDKLKSDYGIELSVTDSSSEDVAGMVERIYNEIYKPVKLGA